MTNHSILETTEMETLFSYTQSNFAGDSRQTGVLHITIATESITSLAFLLKSP